MSSGKLMHEALDILTISSDEQCRALLTQVIKLRPSVVVTAYSNIKKVYDDPVKKIDNVLSKLKEEMHQTFPNMKDTMHRCGAVHGKIACIKLHRLLTGDGLKESKSYVDNLDIAFPPVSINYFPPVIKNGDLAPDEFGSVLSATIHGVASLVFRGEYESAFKVFKTNFSLNDDFTSFILFKRYLKALFIIS